MPIIEPIDQNLISEQISGLSREPFREILARFLGCSPTEDDIRAFARKSPDRWAQAVSILAKGSGYSDKREVEHNFNVLIGTMSDADLFHKMRELELELQKQLPHIEGEVCT